VPLQEPAQGKPSGQAVAGGAPRPCPPLATAAPESRKMTAAVAIRIHMTRAPALARSQPAGGLRRCSMRGQGDAEWERGASLPNGGPQRLGRLV
jgi:hypothetical protein